MKLTVLLLPIAASALRLPAATGKVAAAASFAPLPALAYGSEPVHRLVEGTDYGDVLMSASNFGSAALAFGVTVGVAKMGFDFLLKYGTEEACIIDYVYDKEVCGHIIDPENDHCVLSDTDGWVCAA